MPEAARGVDMERPLDGLPIVAFLSQLRHNSVFEAIQRGLEELLGRIFLKRETGAPYIC